MLARAIFDTAGAESACTVILIPGIQGRWEWMRPTIEALRRRHRVVTFSLYGTPGRRFFDAWSAHIDEEVRLDTRGVVVIVGVSFGGAVATHYAARHGHGLAALVLASTPSPRWPLEQASRGYLRYPRLSLPRFAARATKRLLPEIRAWSRSRTRRLGFFATQALRTIRWPVHPQEMAAWVDEWHTLDLVSACANIAVPTLVLTGEPALDRVVPVESSLDHLQLIRDARHVMLTGTGHLGLLTRPEAFADAVSAFAAEVAGTVRGTGATR